MEFLEGVPLITFSSSPDHPVQLFVKRTLDVVVSAALLILLLPVVIVIGLLVKMTSRGPVH